MKIRQVIDLRRIGSQPVRVGRVRPFSEDQEHPDAIRSLNIHFHIALRRTSMVVHNADEMSAGGGRTPRERAIRNRAHADERVPVEPEQRAHVGSGVGVEHDAFLFLGAAKRIADLPSCRRVIDRAAG
jgi:hypothetical protein